MLRPAMSQIIREGESYYAFVVAVARHAREIADYWADNGLPMEKKPVTASLEDFASGKVRVRDGKNQGCGRGSPDQSVK